MEEHVIKPIGTVGPGEAGLEIRIDAPYRKALRGLDEFSHVLALGATPDGRLILLTLKIASIDFRRGVLVVSDAASAPRLRGMTVVDLKPFLPCEDFVAEPIPQGTCPSFLKVHHVADGSLRLPEAGVVRTAGGRPCLQFAESDVPVEEGAVVRVVWWFSRFDGAKYRRTTTCRPPYETDRELGVFATRSPVRPNPIALTTVKVRRVDRALRRAFVSGIECFDGTPFLGVLPFDAAQEAIDGVRTGAWARDWPRSVSFSLPGDDAAETDRIARELDAVRPSLPEGSAVREDVRVPSVHPSGIAVRGARTNNLKGIDVFIPYGKITAVVGVSGSGKSSLAVDTIAAECQRRMDCFGDRAEEIESVAADEMSGCLPVIRIAQRRLRPNVRSTVETFSGVATHLRALYARFGARHRADEPSVAFKLTPSTFSAFDPDARCPICDGCGVRLAADPALVVAHPELSLLEGASPLLGRLDSFLRKPNANWMKGQAVALAQKMRVDLSRPWRELPDDFRRLLLKGDPSLTVTFAYSGGAGGRGCETSRPLEGLLPAVERLWADGGASSTAGKFLSRTACPACHGERLAGEGRLVTLCGVRYPVCAAMSFGELERFLDVVASAVREARTVCCEDHIASLRSLCRAARRLGLEEIELNRLTSEVSGGEAQRLKLLAAFHNRLSGILYVLDEPSQNLGRTEYGRVSDLMRNLTDEGNTVLMVEHNPEMIAVADHVIEIGPGAGVCGGTVVAEGGYAELASNPNTLTGSCARNPPLPKRRNPPVDHGLFPVRNVCCHTLQGVDVDFRTGALACITGVSGSGKSSLLYGGVLPQARASGLFDEVIVVESRLACSTPRSTIATYTGIMDDLRRAYGRENSAVHDRLLRSSVEEAEARMEGVCPRAAATCRLLVRNGLGYLKLGQQTATLSGGEAARLKIACSLGVRRRNRALYLLDEPTCGLHFADIDRLLSLLFELLDAGNSVIAIEHNARFLSAADQRVVMGPGSGRKGGRIIAA